jgi:hypothetical protein
VEYNYLKAPMQMIMLAVLGANEEQGRLLPLLVLMLMCVRVFVCTMERKRVRRTERGIDGDRQRYRQKTD